MCVCEHSIIINETEGLDLKESKESYMGSFGRNTWKGEYSFITIIKM